MAKSNSLSTRLIGLQVFKELTWGLVAPATARLMAIKPVPEFTPNVKSTILDEQRHSLIPGFNSYVGMRGGAFSFGGTATYEEFMLWALGALQGGVVPAAGHAEAIASSTNPASPALIVVTTAAPHGLLTGAQVVITGHDNTAANGMHTVTKTGPSTFTIGVAGSGGAAGTAVGTVDVQLLRASAVDNTISVPVTITTVVNHGLLTGAQVVITDCQQAPEANGAWKITVTGLDTFTLNGSTGTGVTGSGDYGLIGLSPFTWTFLGPDENPWNPLSYTFEHAYDMATVQAGGSIIQKFGLKGEMGKAWEWTMSGFCKSYNQIDALAISASTDANPIQITTTLPHGLLTGNSVLISDHLTNVAANGYWNVTVIDANNFTLDTSVGSGAGAGSGGTAEMILTQSLPNRQIEAILFPTTQVYIDPAGGSIGTTLMDPGILQSFDVQADDGIKEVRGQGSLFPTDFVYEKYTVATTLTFLLTRLTKQVRSQLYKGNAISLRLASASGVKAAVVDYSGVITADPKEYTDKGGALCLEVKLEAMYDSGSLANFFRIIDTCPVAVLP